MDAASASSHRTLARVTAILDAVDGGPANLSEISRRTGLSVSTVHRLTHAMVEYDLLGRGEPGLFAVGPRFLRAALDNVALPRLEGLRDATGESVQLWLRQGDERVCRLSVESGHDLRAVLSAGSRIALPKGSAGRLLAETDEAMASVAEHGWVESSGDRVRGLASVSAPVRWQGRVIAALCIVLPSARVIDSPGRDLGATAARVAAELSDALPR